MADLLDEVLGVPKRQQQTIEQATRESLPVGSQVQKAVTQHVQNLQSAQQAGAPIADQAVNELLGQSQVGAYRSGSLPIQNPGEGKAGFTTMLKAESVDDPKTKLKIFAHDRFPNDPNAVERYAMTSDGKVIYLDDDGKIYQETHPGVKSFVAGLGGQAAPIAGGIAGGMVAAPELGVIGPAVGGALGAAAGGAVRKAIGNVALGEPISPGGVGKEMATQGGMSFVGSMIGLGIAKGAEKLRVAKDIKALDPAKQQQAEGLVQQFGASKPGDPYTYLTPAETTELGSLKGQQKTAFQMPTGQEGAQKFEDWRFARSKDIFANELNKLSTQSSPEAATVAGSNAAQKILNTVDTHIAETGKEAYGGLWQQYKSIPEDQISTLAQLAQTPDFQAAAKRATLLAKNFQKQGLVTAPGLTMGKASEILSQFSSGKGALPPIAQTPEGLNMIKTSLDAMIKENAARGINAQENAATVGIVNQVKGVLDNVTKGGYSAANAKYGQLIQADEALKSGIVGALANVKDAKLQNLAARVFDPERSGPESIKLARDAFLNAGHEDEWNQLARSYMYLKMRDFAKPGVGQENRINQPALWARDMFFDPDVRANMREVLSPAQFANFNNLAELFRRTAVVPRGGSDTASKLYGAKQLEQEGRTTLSKGVGIARQPLLSLQNGIDRMTIGDFAAKLVDKITQPDASSKLRQLRTMTPNSAKMVSAFGSFLGVLASPTAAQEPAPIIPPALQQVQIQQ
jgi:hypothetical protein